MVRALAIIILAAAAGVVLGTTPVLQWSRAVLLDQNDHAPEPTIAVLPFDDPRADEEAGHFGAGVTEDLISALGRFSELTVLSWNAVAPYQERKIETERPGEALGVRYLVSGSVRRASDRVRVAMQLAETERGALLWSDTFEAPLTDVFDLQDRISRAIADALSVEFTQLELKRAGGKSTSDLEAYDRVLLGRQLMRLSTREANLDARELFEEAVAADPRYAAAHAGLGWTLINDVLWGWTERPLDALERAGRHARSAIAHARNDARAHALLANVLRLLGESDRALEEAERAIALNPSDATGHAVRGALLLWRGQLQEAVQAMERSIRLDSRPPNWLVANLAQSYLLLDRHDEALRALARIDARQDEDPIPHALRAAVFAELGRSDEAARATREVRRLSPFFNARAYAGRVCSQERADRLWTATRRAGL